MKIEQQIYADGLPDENFGSSADLVLLFGAESKLLRKGLVAKIKDVYPKARIFGCSTAGEIIGTRVLDDSLVVTAIAFEGTKIKGALVKVDQTAASYEAGWELAESIPKEDLKHVFVLSEGLEVNGSELVRGLRAGFPPGTIITGGLSGDGERFRETYVLLDDDPRRKAVGIVGFYGERFRSGHGCFGGWDPFGPERLITRSRENVLYELDGKSALDLYKRYLGEHAKDLPAAGLLFPLSLRTADSARPIVRTLQSIDEGDQSMSFAGDMPANAYARLMKANVERLIDGATDAGRMTAETLGPAEARLAVLISCVGRKMILKQRTEEETEGVRDALGGNPICAGFYSYGEISPYAKRGTCELHNQTMTVTAFSEVTPSASSP
jgi:hypothetical protein